MTKRGNEGDCGKGKGKRQLLLWVLAVIILTAVWSMLAGSVTLATNNHDSDSTILQDLDVLDVEERVKVVRQMWDVYTHTQTQTQTQTQTHSVGLPKFWCEAFESAYEELASDVPALRDAAVSEIAKMSLRSLPLRSHSHSLTPPSSPFMPKLFHFFHLPQHFNF